MLQLVDTHCHLDWRAFDPDRDEVVQRAIEAGVTRMVTIGVDLPSSRRAIELAEQYEPVYAAVGVHPNDCVDFDAGALAEVRSLAQHSKVVAIGEIGLDYYWHKVEPDAQARAFESQLDLAAELNKPVIIHSRDAAPDMIAVLDKHIAQYAAHSVRGVLHSYFDDLHVIQQAFELGYFVGVTGPITFKKSDRERAIVGQLPLDRLPIETDAPFLTPVPHRGKGNEPPYVRRLAGTHARVKAIRF